MKVALGSREGRFKLSDARRIEGKSGQGRSGNMQGEGDKIQW